MGSDLNLVEPAKATPLEKLGEGEQALSIANGWVQTKLDGALQRGPDTPSP